METEAGRGVTASASSVSQGYWPLLEVMISDVKATLQVLRLLLVEDYTLFRDALALMLNRQPDMEVAAQCG